MVSAVLGVAQAFAVNVTAMAPLMIGDPHDVDGEKSHKAWTEFKERLLKLKKENMIESVTVDVWWGLVQKDGPEEFDWYYYKKMASVIHEVGLKWTPILSIHACGSNVGDTVNFPLPSWVW